jgi:WD40 repeat protein
MSEEASRRRPRRNVAKEADAAAEEGASAAAAIEMQPAAAPVAPLPPIEPAVASDSMSVASGASSATGRRRRRRAAQPPPDAAPESESIPQDSAAVVGADISNKPDSVPSAQVSENMEPNIVPADSVTVAPVAESAAEAPPLAPPDHKILKIGVLSATSLEPHIHILHPVVKLHLVGADGKPKGKSQVPRAVVQQSDASIPHILPVMTKPYDLVESIKRTGTLDCRWDEHILYNESWSSFKEECYLLLEILDFKSCSSDDASKSSGWHYISWAFVRLDETLRVLIRGKGDAPSRSVVHEKVMLRLQLHSYKKGLFWNSRLQQSAASGIPEVFHQMRSRGAPKSYPASLSLCIQLVDAPAPEHVNFRAIHATQTEQGKLKIEQMLDLAARSDHATIDSSQKNIGNTAQTWLGATGPWCRVPNHVLHKFVTDSKGCMAVSFSKDGVFVACAIGSQTGFKINIYAVATGNMVASFSGHSDIVYDLDWAIGRDELVSASSDGTAKVWTLFPKSSSSDDKSGEEIGERVVVLGHPSFVYCCRYVTPTMSSSSSKKSAEPPGPRLIATGAIDGEFRIWDAASGKCLSSHDLHKNRINRICVNRANNMVYTGDGIGIIRAWRISFSTSQALATSSQVLCEPDQCLESPELAGQPISSLEVDSDGIRMAVVSRDSVLRIFEMRLFTVIQRLGGFVCMRYNIRATFSPDSRFIIAGSEDGKLFVWRSDNGQVVKRAWDIGLCGHIPCIDWNPSQRMVCVCAFAESQPIILLDYKLESDPRLASLSVRPHTFFLLFMFLNPFHSL